MHDDVAVPGAPGNVAGVVLAGGAGRRIGVPKALLQVGGRFLLERAVETLREGGCTRIIVVLGAQAESVRAAVELAGVDVVVNEQWAEGISTSFAAGLRACRGAEAAVVILVDQPGITPQVISRLVEAWHAAHRPVAVATYGGAWRNPVLFTAPVFAEVLAAVHGDVGAKPWLEAHPEQVMPVEVGDIADAADVDTPIDLAKARARLAVRGTGSALDGAEGKTLDEPP